MTSPDRIKSSRCFFLLCDVAIAFLILVAPATIPPDGPRPRLGGIEVFNDEAPSLPARVDALLLLVALETVLEVEGSVAVPPCTSSVAGAVGSSRMA